jgi:hypothetical protein
VLPLHIRPGLDQIVAHGLQLLMQAVHPRGIVLRPPLGFPTGEGELSLDRRHIFHQLRYGSGLGLGLHLVQHLGVPTLLGLHQFDSIANVSDVRVLRARGFPGSAGQEAANV